MAPQDLIQKYGADILRLWVASLDYRDDDPISEEILARCARGLPEDPQHRALPDLESLRLRSRRRRSPRRPAPASRPLGARPGPRRGRADPRGVRELRAPRRSTTHSSTFCATTLSAFYLRHPEGPALRVPAASPERRSAQTALWRIARALAAAHGAGPAVHGRRDLGGPSRKEGRIGPPVAFRRAGRPEATGRSDSEAAWERLTRLREEASVILEQARRDKTIGSSLEGAIALSGSEALEADRAATGPAGAGPRRPVHRLRDRRRRRRRAGGDGGSPRSTPASGSGS